MSFVWIYMDKLLISIGQDPDISKVAGSYAVWLIPALFSQAVQQPLSRFLQTQGLVLPLLYCAVTTLLFHIPVCLTLVYTFGLGSNGAALAISLSYWFNVLILALYMRFSTSCEKTRGFVSDDFVLSVKQFFQYGVPSATMTCLEWSLFELLILSSGLLRNPKLETSVLSICLTTGSLHYVIPMGVGASVSTRVSNELGAGNPEVARLEVLSGMCLWFLEATISSTLLSSLSGISLAMPLAIAKKLWTMSHSYLLCSVSHLWSMDFLQFLVGLLEEVDGNLLELGQMWWLTIS